MNQKRREHILQISREYRQHIKASDRVPQNILLLFINPTPKPRMTQSDRWNKRPCVMRYWSYKDYLQHEANKSGFTLGPAFKMTFYISMPATWSKAKKTAMLGKPHQQKPDIDNLVKGVMDSLLPDNDSGVWYQQISKVWALEGAIKIENVQGVI